MQNTTTTKYNIESDQTLRREGKQTTETHTHKFGMSRDVRVVLGRGGERDRGKNIINLLESIAETFNYQKIWIKKYSDRETGAGE